LPTEDQISAEEKELKELRETLLEKERKIGLLKAEKTRKEREQQRKIEKEQERIKKLESDEQKLYFYRDLVEKEKEKYETFRTKHGKILETESVRHFVAIAKLLVIIDSLNEKHQREFEELRKEIEKLKEKVIGK